MDGNGRLGRLLIVFFLLERQRLPAPLLYISGYLEDYRRDYYDRLQGRCGSAASLKNGFSSF